MYLGGNIGAMNCPISWVTRDNVLAPSAPSPIVHKKSYSIKHVLVSEDMVQHYSHGHNLYVTDNTSVYDSLDTALRGTKYHATIEPFKRRRDGRGSHLELQA